MGGLPGLNLDGKTGYVRALGDVDAMAEAAIGMFQNPELHQELSKQARARAEKFELNTIVAEYESHYERVLAKVSGEGSIA